MTVEDYEARRILEDLQHKHAPATDWKTFTDRLDHCVKDFTGRRSIESHMVRAVADLAYGYVREQLDQPHAEREAEVQKLAGVIERLEERVEIYRTRNEKLEVALSEKRTIREEREAAREDGETDVTISNGYVGWTVAGLEEIAYRLRSGGAIDDTPVEVDKARAKASVPAPNMVTLQHAPAAKDEPEPVAQPVAKMRPLGYPWHITAGLVLLAVIALLWVIA